MHRFSRYIFTQYQYIICHFLDVDINSDIVVYEKTVFVKRKKAPIVSGEVDKIDVRELYDGRENPLNIDFEKRIKFTCSFDNIQNYPFGMQVRH